MEDANSETPVVSRRVQFFGRVQGVGFRFTTAAIAKRLDVNGYVRNVPDGSVEMLACGSVRQVDRLLASLKEEFGELIEGQNVAEVSSGDRFDAFEIRR